MTTTQKVVLITSIVLTGALIGWGIYEGTKKKISSPGGSSEEGQADEGGEAPKITVDKVFKKGDEHWVRLSNGKEVKVLFTPSKRPYIIDPNNSSNVIGVAIVGFTRGGTEEVQQELARLAIAGRGADGWNS